MVHPTGRQLLGVGGLDAVIVERAGDKPAAGLYVRRLKVAGIERVCSVDQWPTVHGAAFGKTLDYGAEERSVAARRLNGVHRSKVTIGGEAGKVQYQLDYPRAREHRPVFRRLVLLQRGQQGEFEGVAILQ